ncbi:MAG: exocyst complex component exo84 [Thelocarpon impressellum]|nr:MAG: exocyst complex component exo84 [Thelocarpon impressellum]
MEDKGKKGNVFSLRKKREKAPPGRRAQISGPIQAQGPSPQPSPGSKALTEKAPQARPQAGGKTADLVKRRYSTRPGALPHGFDAAAPPVPSMPSLPSRYAQGAAGGPPGSSGRGGSSGGKQPLTVDINGLKDPNLRPEQYVANVLSAASGDEIREYQHNLQKIRNRTSTDLQQNVYQNRTRFIEISREAEKLKGEMRTLRSLMSELKTNTNALNQVSSGGTSAAPETQAQAYDTMTAAARKQANRSSVANLEAMWNSQLQSLWKNVEGSQKFLPAIAGRHIVRDSPHWVELNAATWKPRRAIHMFLLNDHLLVASRKKKRVDPSANGVEQRQQPVQSKLVAERCWPLQDIQIVDLSATSGPMSADGPAGERENVANAINVRVGSESFTYRNDRPESNEKSTLLLTFRKAADELRKANRVQDEASGAKDPLTYLVGQSARAGKGAAPSRTLSVNLSKQRPDIMIDVDGKQQNLRWVENQADELDIEIALQRFDEAVARVERLRKLAKGLKSNAIAQDFITIKADERADRLAEFVTVRLVATHSFVHATQENIGWLVRLNFEDRARESYLEARSSVIAKRTRQCIFEGDLQQYIFQIAFVYFTIIRNTVTIYQACFPALMMSACVKWAKQHVDGFNRILGRQLSSFDRGSVVWQECIEMAKQQAALMTEVGLDFKDLVGSTMDEDRAGSG